MKAYPPVNKKRGCGRVERTYTGGANEVTPHSEVRVIGEQNSNGDFLSSYISGSQQGYPLEGGNR